MGLERNLGASGQVSLVSWVREVILLILGAGRLGDWGYINTEYASAQIFWMI